MIPSDAEVLAFISQNTSLGIQKLLAASRSNDWQLSEKRLRKLMGPKDLVPATGLDPSLRVEEYTDKVQVRMLPGRGKGLVATKRLERGEVIWQEDPWIATVDSRLYPLLDSSQMCSHCLAYQKQTITCPHCTAAFCNRLCLSRAQRSSHLPLLCLGQNPPISRCQDLARRGNRHFDAVVRIVAMWRFERETGNAATVEDRVWKGMCRVNQMDKEKQRQEWSLTGEPRIKEWRDMHAALLAALESPKKLICKKPISESEHERWFSFESFLEMLGLAGLNQESSGGLYALHSHLNHSCQPNVQIRNLARSYTFPTPPCDLEPPSERGTNRLTILARSTIEAGEELCIPYVNFELPKDERRQTLREEYGFWCKCPKCAAS